MWRGYMGWGVIKRWYERLARTRRHTYTETTIMQYSPTSFLCLILSHPLSSRSTTNKQTKKGGCVWCDSVCVCVCVCNGEKKKKSKKRVWSDYIGRATNRRPFTGAIPLLRDTETFACCVSTLGRFVSP